MRLGLYGGTFDPVHFGHLLLAEQCREQFSLDEVWFLPSGNPPHKDQRAITSGQARVEMLQFALAGHPQFQVNRMELAREGTTFTVDTLSTLAAEDAQRELFFLIGADSLDDLPTWRNPRRVTELATIVAVNRGGGPPPTLDAVRSELGEAAASRIQLASMPAIDLSSSDIRRRVQEGKSIRYMTPRAVEVYIQEHRLYCA
jgi:nicotinate-nucleotide adenylyltransferase